MSDIILHLSRSHYEAMLFHVSNTREEACGLLAGTSERVELVKQITNVEHSPFRFRMDPKEQVEALLAFEKQDLTLLGIYHSHPLGPNELSADDLRLTAYPEVTQLLWGNTSRGWACRAFRWIEEAFVPIPIYLDDEELDFYLGEESIE